MPSANAVNAKVRPQTRDRVKRLAKELVATDAAIYAAAVIEFDGAGRTRQRAAIARVHRTDGTRHPRVGRGNKIPV